MSSRFSFSGVNSDNPNKLSVFSEWKAVLSPIFDVIDNSSLSDGFNGYINAWASAGLLVSSISSISRQVFVRNETVIESGPFAGVGLIIPLSGKMNITTPARKFLLPKHHGFLFSDQSEFSVECENFEFILIQFPRSFSVSVEPLFGLQGSFYLDVSDSRILALIDFILAECNRLNKLWAIKYDVRAQIIVAMIGKIMRQKYIVSGDKAFNNFSRVSRYISANLTNPDINVVKVCEELDLTRYELNSILKPFGGFKYCINRLRIEEAYRVISINYGGKISFGRLAIDLGFGSESTFRRVFREISGCLPSDVKTITGSGFQNRNSIYSPFNPAWYSE